MSYWYCKLIISPYRPPQKPAFFRSSLHIFFDRRQNLVQALPSFARRGRVFGRNWSQICFESNQNIWCQFFGSNSLGKSKFYNSSKKTSLVEENESRKIYPVCIFWIFFFWNIFRKILGMILWRTSCINWQIWAYALKVDYSRKIFFVICSNN